MRLFDSDEVHEGLPYQSLVPALIAGHLRDVNLSESLLRAQSSAGDGEVSTRNAVHGTCRTIRLAPRGGGRAGRSDHPACYAPFVRSPLPVPASPFTRRDSRATPALVST